MAEADTAPLPKITIEEPPPPPPAVKRSLVSRLGDLPMRVIYRIVVGAVASLAVVVAATVFFVTGGGKGTSTAAGPVVTGAPAGPGATTGAPAGPGAASSAPAVVPTPSGGSDPSAASESSGAVEPSATSESSGGVEPSATPGSSATATSAVPSASSSGSTSVSAQGVASPVPTPMPGRSALTAAQADPRVPKLPPNRKLADFRGDSTPTKGRVRDKRSGVTFPRFVKAWKLVRSSPFATRRMLAATKGAGHRAILASCPVPIAVQEKLKDTAFLAARWTLNYHPVGSEINWTASRPIKVGKRDGWLLGYRVHYKVDGKKRMSAAAVALVEVPSSKPGLVFITIPDAQKKRWADINTIMSHLHPL
ncbi:hypothetical protein [Sphaerisporangium flaviroseum]